MLYPSGRPPWVFDLMAAGCPVIVVVSTGDPPPMAREEEEGHVAAPADSVAIARAIDSLLIDPVRLGLVTYRAADRVRDMPDAGAAAWELLRAFDPDDLTVVSPLREDGDERGCATPSRGWPD